MNALRPWVFVVLLTVAAFAAVFFELGRMDVVTANEGQRAAPPAEMLRSGDYVVPTINGEPYINKPPLLYWAIAGVYRVFGISEWAARVPSALSSVALVLCIYFGFRRKAGEAPARWAAVAMLASPYFIERARWAELDIPLTLATFLGVLALCRAWSSACNYRATSSALMAGLGLGAALLLKGPALFLFTWAAWVGFSLVDGGSVDRAMRTCFGWTLRLFALEVAMKFAAWLFPSMDALQLPLALVGILLLWTWAAWHFGGANRLRRLGLTLGALGVGCVLFLAWGLAVLDRLGWDYIASLLGEQVVERTYTASEINSGSPLYYLLALPLMIAPAGFLLPLHFSRLVWLRNDGQYHFSVIAGWLSILLFSCIAGKEYEYILPAVPFLLLGAGYVLAGVELRPANAKTPRWAALWQRVLHFALPMGALGTAVYVSMQQRYPVLLVEVWTLAAGTVVFALWSARKHIPVRLAAPFAMTLAVVLIALLGRAYHYTGGESPREIAGLAGALAREGYAVEAAKVYPPFAFYAATPIAENMADVVQRLNGQEPYFYVTRDDFVAPLVAQAPNAREILRVPWKDAVLIGNAPLPRVD